MVHSESSSFLYSYLTKRYQRTRICDVLSDWENIIAGVPQGSILGPLLFYIFMNSIFFYIEKSDLCNYADDSTLYIADKSLSALINNLNKDFLKISNWFHDNHLVLNLDKGHFIILRDDKQTTNLISQDNKINYSQEEKVLNILNKFFYVIYKKEEKKVNLFFIYC